MAVREIKTKLTIDSEKQFNREIQEAGRNMRVMASEMKAAAADFNLTGNEMDYLTRKSDTLSSQIKQQETIIKALKDAVASSADAWGDASAKTDGYRIKLANAEASMARLRKELQETNAEMDEMGRDSTRVGRQLENGIGEAADDVSRKFDGMVGSLSSDVSSLSKTLNFATGFNVATTIANGAYEVGQAIVGMVEGSMDYNRQMSFLRVNAEAAGYDFEKIKGYAVEVAGLTGDMDAAIEGMSNLLKAGFEGDELATVVERLSGAIVQLPDTMKFESLAESLLESVSTGSAVGQYAEYLEKMGMDIETVNEALEAAKKNGQEAAETAAIALLSGHGAEEVLAQWKTDNQDLINFYTAQSELTMAQAELARELTPLAVDTIEMATALVKESTELIGQAMDWYDVLKKPETFETSETVAEARENLPGWDNGYVTGAEKAGENDGEEYINGVKKKFIEEAGSMPTWDDFGGGYVTGLEESAKETADDTVKEIDGRFVEAMPGVGKDAMTSLADGVNEYGFLVINAGANIGEAAGNAAAAAMYGSLRAGMETWMPLINASPLYGPQQQGGSVPAPGVSVKGGSVVLNLDGRELGRTGGSYIGAQLGASVDRAETYGP